MWEKSLHFSLFLFLSLFHFCNGQLLCVINAFITGLLQNCPLKGCNYKKQWHSLNMEIDCWANQWQCFFCQWDEREKRAKKKVPSKWNLICVFLFCCSFASLAILVKAQFKFAHNCDDTLALHCTTVWPCSVSIHCIHMSHTIESLVCRWFEQNKKKTNWYTFFFSNV